MSKLHFDIRDIFQVVRLGWSGKKIWVGLCGTLVAWAGYAILAIADHLLAGATMGEIWHRYGPFPGPAPSPVTLAGTAIDVLAVLYVWVVVLLTTCMICKITYQQLKGDDFYSSGDALGFIRQNWGGVVWGPVATLALLIFFVVAGIVIGWLAGLIPWAGELAFGVLFIPIFFAALVAIFISIAFIVSLTMSPAVVGTVGEDALEVAIQSFSLAWSQPWRLVLYMVWMKISVSVGSVLLGIFMASSLGLVSWACGLFMKEKLANMVYVAGQYVPFDFTRSEWLSLDITAFLPAAGIPSGSELLAGGILAVMLILLTVIFSSYALSAYASGLSLIYVILRKRKDDENLLEWEDDEAEDDEEQPEEAEATEDGVDEADSDASAESESGDGESPDTETEKN
ncbi:MAG: hypothetical protein OXR72_06985 [Gemmatimonadota bacterium]|nr:hypothetical protein [Gemmatimonadota bacterium]